MIALLTSTILDVSFGVVWWVTKTTTYGIYNGVSYIVSSNTNYKNTNYKNTNDNNTNYTNTNDKDTSNIDLVF